MTNLSRMTVAELREKLVRDYVLPTNPALDELCRRARQSTPGMVLVPACSEENYSLGHKRRVRCGLPVGHVGNHEARWGEGYAHAWVEDDEP